MTPLWTFLPPAARDHGEPITTAAAAAVPDPTNTSSCPPDVTRALQTDVDIACNIKGVKSSCTQHDSCAVLLEKIAVSEACIAARQVIMAKCYNGGDDIHKEAVKERQKGLNWRRYNYTKRCTEKPKIVPVTIPEGSTQSSKQPEVDKDASITLVGAALIVFLILTAPFRVSPN